ncbi:MAG: metallo-mystery pair system four-Cys motif protein [Leptospiraceae bacterium]|nr:metallo-mystery pair system four-Cys motif protein [Leptospiraceae bacterium]MDW8305751.1 metallo-mystery pair system four-Cys motif protein [Leptospiraceae bacterium]
MKKISLFLINLIYIYSCAQLHDEEKPKLEIEIPFAAKVGSENFSCSREYSGIGAKPGGGSTIKPHDFRFYVHDFEFVTNLGEIIHVKLRQDGSWQYENVALLDFEDNSGHCANVSGNTAATNHVIHGTYEKPAGSIEKIRFVVGVPEHLNHKDRAVAPPPLNLASLHWDWTTGYKHARIDFVSDDFKNSNNEEFSGQSANSTGKFNIHLGATGCTGVGSQGTAQCSVKNRPVIELTFRLGQTIVADLKELLATTDLSVKDKNGPKGCMSSQTDPECKEVFLNFGLDFHFDPQSTVPTERRRNLSSNTVYPTSGQKFFRVE